MTDIVQNFLPPDVDEILRFDLTCVRKDFVGSNISRKLMYEQVKMARDKYKLQWSDGQTPAEATRKAATLVSF